MNHITVAVASKAKHWSWWQSLRGAGVPIISTWIDWPHNVAGTPEPTADDWRVRWERNISDAAAADILLFYDHGDEQQCGAIAEMAAALAHGKQVFLISPHWWSIEHHRRVRKFKRLEDAITAIKSMQAGTELRMAS